MRRIARVRRRLASIGQLAGKKGPGNTELDNLLSDLDRVSLLLKTGSYKETDFIGRNIFDVGRRTEEFLAYMKGYDLQARTWARILALFPLGRIRNIIDVCPGWAPKIELALCYLGYEGEVTVFNKDRKAGLQLMGLISMFRPKYKIKLKAADLFGRNTAKTSLLVANHIIDDLLLDRYAREERESIDTIYASEERMKKAAAEILKKHGKAVPELSGEIADRLDKLVRKNGHIILAQYAGLSEKSLGLKEWNRFCGAIAANAAAELVSKRGYKKEPRYLNALRRSRHKYFNASNVAVLHKR